MFTGMHNALHERSTASLAFDASRNRLLAGDLASDGNTGFAASTKDILAQWINSWLLSAEVEIASNFHLEVFFCLFRMSDLELGELGGWREIVWLVESIVSGSWM